jgi:hypothetical protein
MNSNLGKRLTKTGKPVTWTASQEGEGNLGKAGPASHDGKHGLFYLIAPPSTAHTTAWSAALDFEVGGIAMDGLEVVASLETSSSPRGSDRLKPSKQSDIRLAPRIKAALRALLEALDYVHDLDGDIWDFAIELSTMRQMKLTNSDLRWLIGRGLVEYAIEVTSAGDSHRSFRRPMRPLFIKKACFVLSLSGEAMSRGICGRGETGLRSNGRATVEPPWLASVVPLEPLLPKWDRDRQELKVGSIVVKRFKVPAANQEAILAVFEEESWPPRIDDPLPPHHEQPPKRRLQETIKSLNRNQKQSLIRFLGDGSGQGVRWEFCGPQDPVRES